MNVRTIGTRLVSWPAFIALLLFLPACAGKPPGDVAGRWEGESGASRLLLTFRPNGEARIAVTVGRQTSTTDCHWQHTGGRICLTNARGQVRWFPIIACSRDELTLRLDSNQEDVCHLHRTGEG